jgi:hypothetical protein
MLRCVGQENWLRLEDGTDMFPETSVTATNLRLSSPEKSEDRNLFYPLLFQTLYFVFPSCEMLYNDRDKCIRTQL